jgi:hypothetical protein
MNNKGMSLIVFLLFLPLVTTLLYSFFWMLWFLKTQMQVDNLCQHHVLKAQEHLVAANNQVMALNPKALALNIEKKALNVAILTGPPPVKAAAKIRKKIVVAKQKMIRKMQRGIFAQGHFLANQSLFSMQREYAAFQKRIYRFWQQPQAIIYPIITQPKKTQLKIQFQDIAPTYRRTAQHKASQSINAQWALPLKTFLPPWLLQWVPVHTLWRGGCASHPNRKGEIQWRAVIGEANHSSKPSLF